MRPAAAVEREHGLESPSPPRPRHLTCHPSTHSMARKNAAQKKVAEEARQKLAQENPEEAARLDEERAAKSKKQMHRKDKP